ncbi:unnamed protein product [Nyctereutes procyonoides]|uniref:(raccoon dog) hypothetical protein n=1 Tax=Nyctereutes procyonoides TaxID=34880 RepID=A0A811YY31_NYCPR|nr:unnamed protein product [Nyctereutes procyonoides]
MKDKLQLPQGKQFGVTAESFEEGEVPHHKRRSFRSQMFQSYIYDIVENEIRNKTGMSTLTTAIQHSIGSPSLSNQTTKRH